MRSSFVFIVAAVMIGGCAGSDYITSPSSCTASELTAQNLVGDWVQVDFGLDRTIRLHLVPNGTSLTGSGTLMTSDGKSSSISLTGNASLVSSSVPGDERVVRTPSINVDFDARGVISGHLSNMLLITPDSIDEGSSFCPDYATDHPTLILTIHGGSPKRVYYYTGCFLRDDHTSHVALDGLRGLAAALDSVTGARRWIQPARRR
jgi:hypothetical protein